APDRPLSATSGSAAVGRLYLGRGDLARAVPALERGLELSEAWHIGLWEPVSRARLGYAYALGGRVAEGLALLERAIEQEAAMGRMASHSSRLAALGEAYLIAGRLDDATALARRALALARERTERGNEGWALRLRGAVADRIDRSSCAPAEASYPQAIALSGELGCRRPAATPRLGTGALSPEP